MVHGHPVISTVIMSMMCFTASYPSTEHGILLRKIDMKRDKDFIGSKLYREGDKLFCKEKCIIEFPKWYEDKEMATIQDVVDFYGIFAIIIGDTYSVSVIPTLVQSTPIMIKEIERDGIVYNQLIYGKDDCILNNIKVVKMELLSYNFFETFYMYARAPWFIEYEDLLRLMDNLPVYANSNVGGNFISNELTTSFITRSKMDKRIFFRQNGNKGFEYVDLMNVYYSALSTTNKIAGNYFMESMTSAIVQPEKETTKLEDLVRE